MGERSKIEWTDNTFNPWIGCTKVGPGCDNCYAEDMMDHRYHRVRWGTDERVRTSEQNWRKPVAWNRAANGTRPRVFCASLADVFDNAVNETWRADLFALIHATPNLDWLLLTKRIGNAATMLPADWGDGWPNVWVGATVVNQHEYDRDVPKLLDIPAHVRFLSIEPLLGHIEMMPLVRLLDWVIVGGESGSHARPLDEASCIDMAKQCLDSEVAFFFKQGSAANWPSFKDFESFPDALRVRQFPRYASR